MNRLIFTVLGVGLIAAQSAFGQSSILALQARAKDVTIPIYVPHETQPVLALQIGNVFTEYERKGFFRIGALPKLVCDHVRLDLRQPKLAGIALKQAARELNPGPNHTLIEWRAFSLACSNEVTPRLRATRVCMTSMNNWELQGDVRAHVGTNIVKLNRAVLHVCDGGRVAVIGKTASSDVEIILFDPGNSEKHDTRPMLHKLKESR